MLNPTTTFSYGLRMLANLALEGVRPKQLHKIAHEEGIPLSYLRKLIPALGHAGLIRSVKGPGGGFVLVRDPSQISLLEISTILGSGRRRHCMQSSGACHQHQGCRVKDLLGEVCQQTYALFEAQTLAGMLERRKRYEPSTA